ncbi:MAG: peptidyl-prolyl cis-trans isomerase [Fimbriimonadaceae bacterium]|nr:peptidyl-prolyl cis-trans isomerase [Fimbriimonadaceae bacterium]
MSISNIRNMIENKGCQVGLVVIGVLSLIGLAGVGSFGNMFGGLTGADKQIDQTPPVLELGNIKLTEANFQAVFSDSSEKMGQLVNQDPDFRLQFMAKAATTLANQAAVKAIAAERKVNLDDKAIIAMAEKSLNDWIAQQKEILVATGKIKADASASEVDAAMKAALGGRDIKDLVSARVEAVKQQLADPAKREVLVNGATVQALIEAEAAKHQVSDDVLKKDYESFTLDQVPFQDQTVPLEERKALAEKALADAKAGKSLEEIRKAYAPKETTAPVTMSRGMINLDPVLKPIGDLKVGEWSGVLIYQGFPVVYRVAKIAPNLPADFEKNVAKYRESHSMTLAQKAVNDLVTEKVKGVKWLSAGLELIVNYQKETADRELTTDSAKRKAALQKLNEDAKALAAKAPAAAPKDGTAAVVTSRLDDEAAALVRNATSKQLYAMATPTEQADMAQDRLESLQAVLQFVDSTNVRMEIVDVAVKADDNDTAAENLAEAAMSLGRPDPVSEAAYATISKKLDELKKANKLTDATAKKAEEALQSWLKDKIQYEKDQEELKKQNEERDKALKAEEEKAAAEKAAAEKDKKPADKPKAGDAKSGEGKSMEDQFLVPNAKKGN